MHSSFRALPVCRLSRRAPLALLGILAVAGGVGMIRGGSPPGERAPGDPGMPPGNGDGAGARLAEAAPGGESTSAQHFCINAGYLCADLADAEATTLRRWIGHEGTLVVHVPLPTNEEPTTARALQRAAASGIRAWNNQPFPILIDLRGDRNPHFSIDWSVGLSGTQLGVARTSWSEDTGLRVVAVSLASRHPNAADQVLDARQVRLTAAHEMGHALGLPHSDQPRDVMYPTNTATSMSARDYRSIEVLYSTPNGTVIRR